MKTKISHRLLSLFAAVLVAFSMLSTAFASEIQPRASLCPDCGKEMHRASVIGKPLPVCITKITL